MPTTTELDVRRATVKDFRDRAYVLLSAHWREVGLYQDEMRLAPDWERYELLEKNGSLITLGAWAGDRMVGYSVNLLERSMHYMDNLVVSNDVLFVHPDWRQTTVGRRLMRATEKAAKEAGATLVMWHAKTGTPLQRILERDGSGYDTFEVIYSRKV